MTLSLNGTAIENLYLNGSEIDSGYLNGTQVHEGFATHYLTVGVGSTFNGYESYTPAGSITPTTLNGSIIEYLGVYKSSGVFRMDVDPRNADGCRVYIDGGEYVDYDYGSGGSTTSAAFRAYFDSNIGNTVKLRLEEY